VEVTTIADVPAGTGLGSSSSLAVGLLNALYAFSGRHRSAEQLAREACEIEIDVLNKPIGRQDQYAAAFGGLNYIQFNPDETVFVEPVICLERTKQVLQDSLVMLYTGLRGDNDELLGKQQDETLHNAAKQRMLETMVCLARRTKEALEANDVSTAGSLLHQNWEIKKQIAAGISNPVLDGLYETGRGAGALGGKILGAGGGGFLLFCCLPECQERFRREMQRFGLRELAVRMEPQGSRIIYVGD
jgi:D-glycero-alpha-D-manno-heptose-7-phosphate kinase